MAMACGTHYADSYLSGATEIPGALIPKNSVSHERLQRPLAMKILSDLGIKLLPSEIPISGSYESIQ